MSYQLKIIKDYPVGFWPLDELSGVDAVDISGCGNNANYSGSLADYFTVPLVSGGNSGKKITSSSSILFPIVYDYDGNIADIVSINDPLSFEAWIYPNINTEQEVSIFADLNNNIGLVYKNKNIQFRFGNHSISYTLPYVKKSHHLVGVFNVSGLYLYVDGILQSQYEINEQILITGDIMEIISGPTSVSSDWFILDAPAVYRYALSQQKIISHYLDAQTISPAQIVIPDQGVLFDIFDNKISTKHIYSYPKDKNWTSFITEDLLYNPTEQSISIYKSLTPESKTVEINDFFSIPISTELDSSKVEWDGDTGVVVQISLDGTNFINCINGTPVPEFEISGFNADRQIYVKIIMSTNDASILIPKLRYLSFSFYSLQTHFAINDSSYISTMYQDIVPENFNVSMGNKRYPILSRDYRNGIRCYTGSGFYINTQASTKSIEFFYSPETISTGGLVSTESGQASEYSWNINGDIYSTNISAIFVNGINLILESNINSIFKENEIYHIVIIYVEPISEKIKFNYVSNCASSALFQNIALYSAELSESKIQEHYGLYTATSSILTNDSSMSMTENSFTYYNNDWIVVENS